MKKPSIGEATINPEIQQKIAPDVMSYKGKEDMYKALGKATIQKKALDTILKEVAKNHNADFTSRIKNPETVVQKIAQKRLEGRDYNIKDVNDHYGGRIVVPQKSAVSSAVDSIKKLAQSGAFSILKSQEVKKDTYSAHHMDISTPSGTKGEIQITTPQQALEGVANHSLRSVHGENPPPVVERLRNIQASIAKKTPNDQANAMTQAIQALGKKNNDKPLDPRLVASIMQK